MSITEGNGSTDPNGCPCVTEGNGATDPNAGTCMTEGNGSTDLNGCICMTEDSHHASHRMYLWPPGLALLSLAGRGS